MTPESVRQGEQLAQDEIDRLEAELAQAHAVLAAARAEFVRLGWSPSRGGIIARISAVLAAEPAVQP